MEVIKAAPSEHREAITEAHVAAINARVDLSLALRAYYAFWVSLLDWARGLAEHAHVYVAGKLGIDRRTSERYRRELERRGLLLVRNSRNEAGDRNLKSEVTFPLLAQAVREFSAGTPEFPAGTPTHFSAGRGPGKQPDKESLSSPDREEKTLGEDSRAAARGELPEKLKSKVVVLKHWRTGAKWQAEFGDAYRGEPKMEEWPLDWWRGRLDRYGGAPEHLATSEAFRQAVELGHELQARLGGSVTVARVVNALAYWLAKAHEAGTTIQSLGVVALDLARRANSKDDAWVYDLPDGLPESERSQTEKLANAAVAALDKAGILINRRDLLSNVEMETLACLIRRYDYDEVVAGMNREIAARAPNLREGYSIAGWTWFDTAIKAARNERQERSRKPTKAEREAQQAAHWERQRMASLQRYAMLKEVALAAVAQLAAAGIEVDAHKLTIRSQLDALGVRFRHDAGVDPGPVLTAAVARFIADPARTRTKVYAWSNLGDAIRAELAERRSAAYRQEGARREAG
jgi:hypothetical protein